LEDSGEIKEAVENRDLAEHPAVERTAGEVEVSDAWVSLIGTVISRDPKTSSITLDDGTGQVDVKVHTIPELGSLVRVIARVFTSGDEVTLDAIIVQDFSSFDVELYRRIVDLEGRVFSREGDSHRQG